MIEVFLCEASGNLCALLFLPCAVISAVQLVNAVATRQTRKLPFIDFDTYQYFSFGKLWIYLGLVFIVLIIVGEN